MSLRPLLVLAILAAAPAWAQDHAPPRLDTQEAYIAEVGRAPAFDIKDMRAVFAFVFEALPNRVKVLPTENYYYFSFLHGGLRYAGNIRLENGSRDDGKVHFAYGFESKPWREQSDEGLFHILLDASHGVTVEKIDALAYRVTHAGKSVVFELNDLSRVVPPPGLLRPDERYIGPVFDESGLRFFLVYDRKLKAFHFLLDETTPVAETFFRSRVGDRVMIGKRTGFAVYREHERDRKILIGVFWENVRLNTYFDGPFDQLPDNFIEGESLRSAILEVDPSLKGKIDRFGSAPNGETRFLIAPYINYDSEEDLAPVHRCAVRRAGTAAYARCFVLGEGSARAGGGRRKAGGR